MELIIETSFYQDVYPAENHDVYSFVGRFCEKNGITLPIPFDESKISMQVQSLERTFIDELPPHTRDFSRELGGIFLDFTFIYCIISIWIKAFI